MLGNFLGPWLYPRLPEHPFFNLEPNLTSYATPNLVFLMQPPTQPAPLSGLQVTQSLLVSAVSSAVTPSGNSISPVPASGQAAALPHGSRPSSPTQSPGSAPSSAPPKAQPPTPVPGAQQFAFQQPATQLGVVI